MLKKTQKGLKNTSLGGYSKKIILSLIVIYIAVFLINSVSAFSNNSLFNGTDYNTEENLNLSGSNNFTRTINIPFGTTLTNGYINITSNGINISKLQGYWNFDETSGTTFYDYLGRTNLTLQNVHPPGKFNNAYGPTNPVYNATLNVTNSGNITIDFWLNKTSAAAPGYLLCSYYTGTEKGSVCVVIDASAKIAFYAIDSVGAKNTNYIPTTAQFTRYTMTVNSSSLTTYVNGILNQTVVLTGFISNLTIPIRLFADRLGTGGASGYNMDELVIWNYTLSYSDLSPNINITKNTQYIELDINPQVFTTSLNIDLSSYINSYLLTCSYIGDLCNVSILFSNSFKTNLKYSNISFNNIGFRENNQIYNISTYETAKESFLLNVTYDSNFYEIGTATFVYNGVIYNVNAPSNYIFTKTIDIPTISSVSNFNFYWNLSLTNSSGTYYFISNISQQTVSPIFFNLCNTTITTKTLNFTFADEETLILHNSTFNSIFNFSLSPTIGYSRLYSYNNISIKEVDICIFPNDRNFYISTSINYNPNATVYGTRFFNQINFPVNSTRQDITLYSLKLTSLTTFIIQVQDNNLLPVSGVIVETWKFEPSLNSFILVQTGLTDVNGQTSGQFIINSANYRFVVKQNGNIIYTSQIQAVTATTTPYTITIAIGSTIPNPWISSQPLDNLLTSITFNKTTNRVTWTYSDTSGNFTNSNFIVAIQNYTNGHDLVVCNISSTNIAAVTICDLSLTGNKTGLYYANGYVTRGSTLYLADGISFVVETFTSLMGGLGIILGMIIIIISAMAFKFNEIAGVWMTTIAIIGVNMLGLISFGPLFITGVIALAIVLTVMFKQ